MTIMESHHHAMELAARADRARTRGNLPEAHRLLLEALLHETAAAMKLKDRTSIEPTRSVFFRSAASLALECEQDREAERLIAYGLSGNPPDEIAEELRDLLERVHFQRHLQLRGLRLDRNEMQLSIWGPAVGLGFVQSREFSERLEKVEALAVRTLERKMNRSFRNVGRPSKEVTDAFEVYVSLPRAASFAVTIRLAGDQKYLFDVDLGADVVQEILEGVKLLNDRKEEELRERMGSDDYFQNFVGIAKQLAPDGKRVSHVGLTVEVDGKETSVEFRRKRTDWGTAEGREEPKGPMLIEVRGNLRFADATKTKRGIIELVEGLADEKKIHKIKVPLPMMADIVRPMFEHDVAVRGRKDKRGAIILEDIFKLNEPT